ncbi:hypothetical protein [Mycobacterium sp.]|uniref:hypothetical protein n=1 Tax=Mycobacterium sp. TaxID=1785 RepID=UPI00262F3A93|nr:hypothetical protein [Mycobacterium sp.]
MEDQQRERERTGVSADSKAGLHHRCFACRQLIVDVGFCDGCEPAWLDRLAELGRGYVRHLREWGGDGHEAQIALVVADYSGSGPVSGALYADGFDHDGFTEWSRGRAASAAGAPRAAAVEPPGPPSGPELPPPPRGRRRSAGTETDDQA